MQSRVSDEKDIRIMIGVLDAVARDSRVTQRDLAGELGIALGLANAYLRRCVRKGLVKIGTAPLNRYAYYLTPSGFAEKSRLTTEYLTLSFRFFRTARAECTALLEECRRNNWRRVILLGSGDLAEVAVLSSVEVGVEVVAVVDGTAAGGVCAGCPVVAVPPAFDAVLVTDMRAPAEAVGSGLDLAGAAGLAESRVLVPRLLGISGTGVQRGTA